MPGRAHEELGRRLSEAEATIAALLSGQIDAVVDARSQSPVLLSKAQQALRESEERYRSIVETANEGIGTLDLQSRVTFANSRLADMLGYGVAGLVGKSIFELMSAPARSDAVGWMQRAHEGIPQEHEIPFVRGDGSVTWALLKSSAICGADGRQVGTLAMMTDRTRARQAEEALRKSEEQYRQIVETTNDGILKTDRDVRIVFVNQRFAEMLGYETDEMIGTSAYAYMSEGEKALVIEASALRKAPSDAIDAAFRHKDGTAIFVNIVETRLVDGNGEYVGNLGVIRDVTERKKLHSQLMVSDRMASVGTLAAGVAHEINNPLAAVIANLDFALETLAGKTGAVEAESAAWLRAELKEPLDEARHAAERVRLIVRDLKIFSRSPSEEPSGRVDVKAVMESSLRMAWNEIRHHARLIRCYGDVPGVEANEARLGQVFLNLLINAAQALPEGQAEHNEIRVATWLEGTKVLIEVSDTGPGIAPQVLGRIFDAFFTTKAVGAGTGLGLAISQRLVADMGGELTVVSEVGKGTTFRVELSVSTLEEPERCVVAIPLADVGRRGQVLVVDDEVIVLRSIQRVLMKEHDLTLTTSATEALKLCESGAKFDLILCDLMMPDMTGMDLHRSLEIVAPDQAERMLFLTGGAFTHDARQFLSTPPKEHLEKPFDHLNLRAIANRYTR